MNRGLGGRLRRLRATYSDPLLTLLTVALLLMMFFVAPLQASLDSSFTYSRSILAAIMVAGVLVLSGSMTASLTMAGAFALNGTAIVFRLRGDHTGADLPIFAAAWFVVSFTLGAVVARAVFAEGKVTYHRIVGAVLLYLLIALTFVSMFMIVGHYAPEAFKGIVFDDTPELASRLIYFSCVTLTTVGYGDVVPVHPAARSLCNIEAILGQLYPAILIARLVTLQLEHSR